MLIGRRSKHEKIPARFVVAAFVILLGILLLAVAYAGRHETLLAIGLFITLAGVLLELIFVTAGEHAPHLVGHKRR